MTEDLLKERKEIILALIQDENYVPMKLKEMAMLLNVPKHQRDDLKEVLDALLSEGKLSVSKKGKFGKPEAFAHVGIFSGHQRGFGFVTIEGMEQDIFIPADHTMGALHGDKVQLVIDSEITGKRAEGTVIRILEHANSTVIGYYQKNKSFGFVIADNHKITKDIFIPQGKDHGAVTGHKVVVKVTDFGSSKKKPEGIITEILGHVNDPGTDILSMIRAFGLPEEFPDEVMKQVSRFADHVTPEETNGRMDIREWQTVTIDGEDAKDLDDAITITKETDRYILGVHIADVTHYVKEYTPLDAEALKRGTSVYLVDRVIPMLPHKLSNGICSLNSGVDRLALSCIMEIDLSGDVIGHQIAETLIRVDERMTYTAVNEIITNQNPEVMAEYQTLVPMFQLMKELADLLRKKRKSRGSIDFDFPESKIILDENGRAVEIKPYERNAATKIIEDFMLMANETIAEDYFWQELPFVYRTHDTPDPEKMKRLGTFIQNFGYHIRTGNGDVHPKEIQKLLVKIEDTPEEALISRLTLRSMKQAKYTTMSTGHFGLAAHYYTHFTSPIRRYPDLQIHRIIKENLAGDLNEKRVRHYDKILPEVTVKCSTLERRADEAEREVDKMKKCEYMSKRIGQQFDGVISGVTNWGLYVELPNTVEGLIRMTDLNDDFYIYHEDRMELVGERSNTVYKLGQKIKIEVSATDKLAKTIDFLPVKEEI